MNKAELVSKVQEIVNESTPENKVIAKVDVENIVEATIEVVMDAVASGEDVKLPPLGSFIAKKQSARTTKVSFDPENPKTVETPAKMVPKFKAYSKFKDQVSELPLSE